MEIEITHTGKHYEVNSGPFTGRVGELVYEYPDLSGVVILELDSGQLIAISTSYIEEHN